MEKHTRLTVVQVHGYVDVGVLTQNIRPNMGSGLLLALHHPDRVQHGRDSLG